MWCIDGLNSLQRSLKRICMWKDTEYPSCMHKNDIRSVRLKRRVLKISHHAVKGFAGIDWVKRDPLQSSQLCQCIKYCLISPSIPRSNKMIIGDRLNLLDRQVVCRGAQGLPVLLRLVVEVGGVIANCITDHVCGQLV